MSAHRQLVLDVLSRSRTRMDGCTLVNEAAEELASLGEPALGEIEFVLRTEVGKEPSTVYHLLEKRYPGLGGLWKTYFQIAAGFPERIPVFLGTLQGALLASAIPYIGATWNGQEPNGPIPAGILEFLTTLSKNPHSGVAGAAKFLLRFRPKG